MKMTVITREGHIVATLRHDPEALKQGINASISIASCPNQETHEIEVADHIYGITNPDDLHKEVAKSLAGILKKR